MATEKMKVITKVYHIAFDNKPIGTSSLMHFYSLEEARAYRDSINNNKKIVEEYGKVHIEMQIIEREVID